MSKQRRPYLRKKNTTLYPAHFYAGYCAHCLAIKINLEPYILGSGISFIAATRPA